MPMLTCYLFPAFVWEGTGGKKKYSKKKKKLKKKKENTVKNTSILL